MKKVVVVVETEKIHFEGSDLKVLNRNAIVGCDSQILIVMNKDSEIAVFQKWDWWRDISD